MLTYDQKARIARDVILGVAAPADESDEAKAFRESVEQDKAKARADGVMLELPFDWDDNDP